MGTTYTVSTAGNINTDGFISIGDGGSATYRINNVQISSNDLSDVASIGMLDESETVTGNWSFTHASGIEVTNDVNAATFTGSGANLTSIPETAITDGSILARIAGTETITGAWGFTNAAGMNIGGVQNADAILDITSTTKGVLLPRMTTAQKTTLGTNLGDLVADRGMLVYDATLKEYNTWNGTAWDTLGGGGHIIEDEGTPLTQRDNLDFVGDAVTVTDAAPDTKVTINSSTYLQEFYVTSTPKDNYSGSATVYDLVNTYAVASDQLTVYKNGQLQLLGGSNDYTETDTNTITFTSANDASDIIQIVILQPGTAIITPTGATEREQTFTASTTGSEQFTITAGAYNVGTKNLEVWVNGSNQVTGSNFTEDSTTTFTVIGVTIGDIVKARFIEAVGNLVTTTPAVEIRENFVAAGASALFTLTGGTAYTQGGQNLRVYLDGVLMEIGEDYAETTSSSITFTFTPTNGQKVAMHFITNTNQSFGSGGERRQNEVGDDSTIAYNLAFSYNLGGENLQVYEDGVLLTKGDDYAETNESKVTFISAPPTDAKISFVARGTVQVGQASTLNGLTANDLIQLGMLADQRRG